ncbi:hypothetical protein QJS10_CPA01g00907 [Acorus calamus]|uniref:1-acyl-sn-glycerol-3-phosphate acyltransferase n=1 Tax=Acorus calamus TaxID=4465 RepID=A0AAV9FKS0_ACOCL|nr:hypothetical protein QJS10_CPA01g00907 [Acorus calamus]
MEGSAGHSYLMNIDASFGSRRPRRVEELKWMNDTERRPTVPLPGRTGGTCGANSSDDDGEAAAIVSWVRIVVCFATMTVTTTVWAVVMVVLILWPYERIRQGNVYGHVTGRMLMWILGNPIKIEGLEFSNTKAIYVCNHASPLDIFLVMWLTPTGTVGIAKKEIVWYPLFGQLYVLANHLRIDRSKPSAAIESMKEAARALVENNLSLIIFPEGTRSKTGRLLPFKKGFVHIALQSKLPIVPMVLINTHNAWRNDSLRVRPSRLTVKFLPPIETDDWSPDKVDEHVRMVHRLFVDQLPEPQRPVSEGNDLGRISNKSQ